MGLLEKENIIPDFDVEKASLLLLLCGLVLDVGFKLLSLGTKRGDITKYNVCHLISILSHPLCLPSTIGSSKMTLSGPLYWRMVIMQIRLVAQPQMQLFLWRLTICHKALAEKASALGVRNYLVTEPIAIAEKGDLRGKHNRHYSFFDRYSIAYFLHFFFST